ncbi:MAG: ribosomal protein S12 methylthiotransferase RimO [Omnitrophica WOR_2 bacterium RIFCSPLOWO2_12_FULL_46_30]|nr:MAG: ribosomal protein S12 methylthiotransferase RimO [Omnitrophica WOR_2 bacterium RIFCSPLOWO2_02_FULL_45_28]OGX52058.1 MAG: ribosomal protein S12 methylthiotransferase RimO [Omnitrophica WOR_2 bacterium RIFCSPLOWO2_12_FULL_46_30]
MHKAKANKVGILSLGCPRNLVDSQNLLGCLSRKGYQIVDIQDAEIGLVNTCSFIEEAKKESIEAILGLIDLKKEGRLRKVIVAGCLVQRYKEELLPNLEEIDAFVGRMALSNENKESFPLTPRHFAYLKISEGCNHTCSFCVIPKIKGHLQSRRMESILEEVRIMDNVGKREINIIGQDASAYGLDIYKKLELSRLLRKISASLKNVRWLRLLYLHPQHLTDGLMRLIADEPRICKYVDLPLQHINNRILKTMRRRTDKRKIMQLLAGLRKRIPGVAVRTSLLVGFPGETEKEFSELLSFVKEQQFERLGVFRYSREEGTPAFSYPGQVPEKLKEERFNIIMQEQQEISRRLNQKFLGRECEVLIDERSADGTYMGRLNIDAPEVDGLVYVKTAKHLEPGAFVRLKITDTYEYDLVGNL